MLLKNFFFIKLYFFIISVFAISNIFRFFKTHEGFRFADWLINYEAGFVRRGLFGSLLNNLSDLTGARIELLYLLLISFFYLLFFYLAFCLIKKNVIRKDFLLLILSPLSFHFITFETRATAGKEILLFVFFIILIFFFIKKIKLLYTFLYFHIFSILILLSHEALAFFFSFIYLFLLLLQNNKNYLIIRYNIIFSIFFLTISLFFLYFYSGTADQVRIICNSLYQKNIIIRHCDNLEVGHSAIAFLQSGTVKNNIYFTTVLEQITKNNYLLTYFISFLVSFFPIFNSIKIIKKNNIFLNFSFFQYLIACFFFILPVFVALDWGRWLHISYILIILIIFAGIELKYFTINYNKSLLRFIKKKYLLFIFILYFFLIDVPLCCTNRVLSPIESIYNRIDYFINKN